MEHLPTPAGRFRPHPQIDFVCHEDFTVQPDDRFETYPKKYGLEPEGLMQTMNFASLNHWKADSLMQEWLFFVLLADFFRIVNVEFKMQDFIEPGTERYKGEPPRKIVTTRRLKSYLQKWHDLESDTISSQDSSSTEQQKTRRSNVLRLVQQSQTSVLNLLQSENEYVSSGPFMFWIVCIQETLDNAAAAIYESTFSEEEMRSLFSRRTTAHWPPRRMIQNGSCPNHVQRLQGLSSNTGVYFASSLYLPEGAVSFDHSDCEKYCCNVNYLDRDVYEPKHKCVDGSVGRISESQY